MNIKAFRRPALNENAMSNLVTSVDDFVRPLTNNPILGARILRGVVVASTPTNVPHGLGQAWQGWWVVGKKDNVHVWEDATQAPSSLYITLVADGPGTVDIYIF